MRRRRSQRLPQSVRKADYEALIGLISLPGYQPPSPEQSQDALAKLARQLHALRDADINAINAQLATRHALVDIEWQVHELVLAGRNQVRSQFDDDADAMTVVGLKRASQRRLPGRRREGEE